MGNCSSGERSLAVVMGPSSLSAPAAGDGSAAAVARDPRADILMMAVKSLDCGVVAPTGTATDEAAMKPKERAMADTAIASAKLAGAFATRMDAYALPVLLNLQRQAEINVALKAKVAAKSGTSDSEGVAKTAEQLLERRKQLAHVPEASAAVRSARGKTCDALSKKSHSSMKYERLVMTPSLSYLHVVVGECNATLDASEDGELSYDELQKDFHAVTNSVHGAYAMLCNRWTMLELRGQLEQEPGSSQRGGADALRTKRQFVEDRVYQAADDARVMKDHRDQRWKECKKYDDEKDKKPTGKGVDSCKRLEAFTGLCQSVYLAVPAARLYLRELYFVLAEKRSWGGKVKISRAARVDLEWWSKLPVMSRWNGCKIWKSPTRAKLHTNSPMMASGGVRNLKYPARGFWPDEMRDWHITHLELEAVYKTVQAFLKEVKSKVLPRYYAAWKDPRCEGVDSLAYDWRGENNRVNPPWALLNEVAHKLREEGAAATVVAPYCPGNLDLSEENFKIICSSGVSELTDETVDVNGENIDCGGDYKENTRGGAVYNFLMRSLCERWRSELGQSQFTDLAVKMQQKALLNTALNNYGPKARRFIHFGEQHRRSWLPATATTALLYIASVLDDGGIKSASLQPYLSADYHEDLRFPGPAKGSAVTRAVKGMATIQAELAVQEESIETQRTWLPSRHGLWHHRVKRRLCIPWRGVALFRELVLHYWEVHRDAAWSRSTGTQPDAYRLLLEDPKNFKASVANQWIGLALSELDCRPPEGAVGGKSLGPGPGGGFWRPDDDEGEDPPGSGVADLEKGPLGAGQRCDDDGHWQMGLGGPVRCRHAEASQRQLSKAGLTLRLRAGERLEAS
eukprot:gene3162-biopygen3108